ncbi:MAG: hypothetical protein HYY05_04950 [Chloroflexi bacterium]|nr:hypothetical protein [Chloroflexota bacterium]
MKLAIRGFRRLLAAYCLLPTAYGLLLLGAGAAEAQGLGSIEGQVTNGTAGAPPAAAIQVELEISRGGRPLETRPQTTSGDGRFRFEGLETGSDFSYVLSVLYQDVVYQSGEVRFAPGADRKSASLKVFETTRSDPGLTVSRGLIAVQEIDRLTQTVLLFEIVTLRNPSDRTFLPESEGGTRPTNLVRFSLPLGAAALHPQLGVEAASVLQVDRGFATSSPLLPGESEIGFTYRLPYAEGIYQFERPVVYNQEELRVLVPRDGMGLQGAGLELAGDVDFGSRGFHVYLARDLTAGGRVGFALSGLPPRSPLALLDSVPQALWAALAIAGSIVAATLLSRKARSGAPGATPVEMDRLVGEMARLDQLCDEGPESDTAEIEERRRLKEAAVDLMLRSPPSPLTGFDQGAPPPVGMALV